MSTETPMIYGNKILRAAAEYGESAKRAANALGLEAQGLSSTVINGAILEEYNDRHESITDQVEQLAGDTISALRLQSHQGIKDAYEVIKSMSPEERKAIDSIKEKVVDYPLMIDIGRGNIQSYTAIRLLEQYNQSYPDSDPLALKHYNNDYPALLSDLQNDLSPTTVKFAGLMIKEAVSWGETHIANWNELSQIEKEGFCVYYYNVGQEYLNEKYQAAINDPNSEHPGEYRIDIANTDIAQEYILNKAAIIDAENTPNTSYQAMQRLIANDYFNAFTLNSATGLNDLLNLNTSLNDQDPAAAFEVAEQIRIDPIVLDLDGDGIETLSQDAGIHFDLDNNGMAETVGWVGANDGLLVRDINGAVASQEIKIKKSKIWLNCSNFAIFVSNEASDE